jgi:hypothetical protein
MSFVGRDWKHGTRSADMIRVITNGVEATAMMPFNTRLTPSEIEALARYVRSFDKRLKPEKGSGLVFPASTTGVGFRIQPTRTAFEWQRR